jgi:uncharacterized protein (TIGR00730 family)
MKNLCVFCGSSSGNDLAFTEAAGEMGRLLAERGIGLVFGGGNVGLMGEVARAVMRGGGRAVGVIPEYIRARVSHLELTELIVTDGMHERKAKMYELADAFAALPGGIGTLEELAEIFTWGQIGFHQKPVGLLNTAGFYDPLVHFIDGMVNSGFLKKAHQDNLIVENDPRSLLQSFTECRPSGADKWKA